MRIPTEGEIISNATVETFMEERLSRIRVRVLSDSIPVEWRVEFPKKLRDDYPLGSLFKADLIVCQKRNKEDSSLRGQPYLRAILHTISPIKDQ